MKPWQMPHTCDDMLMCAVDLSGMHFPKRGPATKIVYAPKTHKSRYRNYKQPPIHPMIHTLVSSTIRNSSSAYDCSLSSSCISTCRKKCTSTSDVYETP